MGTGVQLVIVVYFVSLIGVAFGVDRYYSEQDENRELRRTVAAAAALREARENHRLDAERERAGRTHAQEARQAAEARAAAAARAIDESAARHADLREQLAKSETKAALAERAANQGAESSGELREQLANANRALDAIELCPAACYIIKPTE